MSLGAYSLAQNPAAGYQVPQRPVHVCEYACMYVHRYVLKISSSIGASCPCLQWGRRCAKSRPLCMTSRLCDSWSLLHGSHRYIKQSLRPWPAKIDATLYQTTCGWLAGWLAHHSRQTRGSVSCRNSNRTATRAQSHGFSGIRSRRLFSALAATRINLEHHRQGWSCDPTLRPLPRPPTRAR